MNSNIFRLAIISDNQSLSTLNKYICKIVERTIFDSSENSLSIKDLSERIKGNFDLEFDITEIREAIQLKGKSRIILEDSKYSLSINAVEDIKNKEDIYLKLEHFIEVFSKEKNIENKEKLKSNIIEFIYYSFNNNAINLLNLMQNKKIDYGQFNLPLEDITLINQFIEWESTEKNKLIFTIVSFSYEYCMLTTKKDVMQSKEIFKGKQFTLDSNIIFRLAGINNDDKQFVISSFIKKCKEVGIKLIITSETQSEIYRVVNSQITSLKQKLYNQEPISPEIFEKLGNNNGIEDFYRIYYDWCKDSNNKYYDYLSFQQYLFKMIKNTLIDLEILTIDNYSMGKLSEEFNIKKESLKIFKKEKRTNKILNNDSLKCDINNIMFVVENRKSYQSKSIFDTHLFLVSADQLLINWSKQVFSGAPIVVTPSLLLSIILKFSGRTDNDYKAFCHFLSLNDYSNNEKVTFNSNKLLETLSRKTVVKELKEEILTFILNDKNSFEFLEDKDYEDNIEKAFDEVVRKKENSYTEEIKKAEEEFKQIEKQIKVNYNDELLKKDQEIESVVLILAKEKAKESIDKVNKVDLFYWFIQIIVGVVLLILLLNSYIFKIDFLIQISNILIKGMNIDSENLASLIGCLGIIIPMISYGINRIIAHYKSSERYDKLVNVYYEEIRLSIKNSKK